MVILSFAHLKGVRAPNPNKKRVSGAYASTGTKRTSDFFLCIAVSPPEAKHSIAKIESARVRAAFFKCVRFVWVTNIQS